MGQDHQEKLSLEDFNDVSTHYSEYGYWQNVLALPSES